MIFWKASEGSFQRSPSSSNKYANQLETDLDAIFNAIQKNDERQKENLELFKQNQEMEQEIKDVVGDIKASLLNKLGNSFMADEKSRLLYGSSLQMKMGESTPLNEPNLYSNYRKSRLNETSRKSSKHNV